MTDLFEELPTPAWRLRNRLVMAPLTRNRADEAGVPGDLAVEYYAQRATAGLIITEGPSRVPGQGYLATPGLHSPSRWPAGAASPPPSTTRGGRIVAS